MKKILFLIHNLGAGGAEKVLVNLVNNMDRNNFDIHVTALFGGGINEQFLCPDIHYRIIWPKKIPGNSKWMKILSPQQLHKICVKEHFDIEVSYLEGPSARVISGCEDKNTKLISWIHVEQHTKKVLSASFRSFKEAIACYNAFDQTVCVSEYVRNDFCSILNYSKPCTVLYNTVESRDILEKSKEAADKLREDGAIRLITVGTLKASKGCKRLLDIVRILHEDRYNIHLYILGKGPEKQELENIIRVNHMQEYVTLLGYDVNPYRYVAKCDLFVCASYSEGFSTATTEALIVGTPVCTVEVSGMKEMLGRNNEYGIVTKNDDEALLQGIKRLLDTPDLLMYYKLQAQKRGEMFCTEETVKAVEQLLIDI